MELDLWFSADSLGLWVYFARIVINKQTAFFFRQMGPVTNKMYQIRFWPGRCPGLRWELTSLFRPPSRMGRE